MRKLLGVLFATVLLSSLSVLASGQEAPKTDDSHAAKAKKTEAAKRERWEGVVQRSDKEKGTLTVRQRNSNTEKTIHYDSSTEWVSQEHGSKTVNNIGASQVKDGDRVICLGKYDEKGEFHASLISKRLTPH